jgi:hypothetical protein
LKQEQHESEGEEGAKAAAMDDAGEEEIKSQNLVVSPETPPRRPPPSPFKKSNGHASVPDHLTKQTTTKFVSTATQSEALGEEINEAASAPTPPAVTNLKSSLPNGTLTHSILDMQSFSPPRVFLSHQTNQGGAGGGGSRMTHESVNGNIFLSQFHHKTFYPSAAVTAATTMSSEDQQIRRGYAIDLVSEISSPGGGEEEEVEEIQLQSPERARRTKNSKGTVTRLSKKSLQIRVPSGRSPKRQNESGGDGKTEIFDVVGYRLQPQQEGEGRPSTPLSVSAAVAAPRSLSEKKSNRSNSVPRQQRIETPTSRKSNGSWSAVPSKATPLTRDTRQVRPFPKPKTTVTATVQPQSRASLTPRPRSAPPRNQQQQQTRKEVSQRQHQPTSRHASLSRFPSPAASRAITPRTAGAGIGTARAESFGQDHSKVQKKKTQKENLKAGTRKKTEEISLSLNSDYPVAVWK